MTAAYSCWDPDDVGETPGANYIARVEAESHEDAARRFLARVDNGELIDDGQCRTVVVTDGVVVHRYETCANVEVYYSVRLLGGA